MILKSGLCFVKVYFLYRFTIVWSSIHLRLVLENWYKYKSHWKCVKLLTIFKWVKPWSVGFCVKFMVWWSLQSLEQDGDVRIIVPQTHLLRFLPLFQKKRLLIVVNRDPATSDKISEEVHASGVGGRMCKNPDPASTAAFCTGTSSPFVDSSWRCLNFFFGLSELGSGVPSDLRFFDDFSPQVWSSAACIWFSLGGEPTRSARSLESEGLCAARRLGCVLWTRLRGVGCTGRGVGRMRRMRNDKWMIRLYITRSPLDCVESAIMLRDEITAPGEWEIVEIWSARCITSRWTWLQGDDG